MAAFAFPGVQPDMVVIAAGRNERGTGAHPLHQFEAKYVAIEAERAIEIGDLQMDVPDPCACDDGRIVGHVSLLRFRAPDAAQRCAADRGSTPLSPRDGSRLCEATLARCT